MSEAANQHFALCERTTIEIQTAFGLRTIEAWKYSQLAAHQRISGDVWAITHLPSGFSFGGAALFETAEQAVPAMIEMARLSNGWDHLEWDEISALGPRIREITTKHGGHVEPPAERPSPANAKYRTDLNAASLQ